MADSLRKAFNEGKTKYIPILKECPRTVLFANIPRFVELLWSNRLDYHYYFIERRDCEKTTLDG